MPAWDLCASGPSRGLSTFPPSWTFLPGEVPAYRLGKKSRERNRPEASETRGNPDSQGSGGARKRTLSALAAQEASSGGRDAVLTWGLKFKSRVEVMSRGNYVTSSSHSALLPARFPSWPVLSDPVGPWRSKQVRSLPSDLSLITGRKGIFFFLSPG